MTTLKLCFLCCTRSGGPGPRRNRWLSALWAAFGSQSVCVSILFQLISWGFQSTEAYVREVQWTAPVFEDAFLCVSLLFQLISWCVLGVQMNNALRQLL